MPMIAIDKSPSGTANSRCSPTARPRSRKARSSSFAGRRVGQVHPDQMRQRARALPEGPDRRRRNSRPRSEDQPPEASRPGRDGVPAFRAFPALVDHREPDAGADQGTESGKGRGDRPRAEASRPRRPQRAEGQVPWAAVRRPAAAGRDRACAVDGPDLHAVRRANVRARPGNGQRGAGRDGAAREGGDDHDGRHSRDGLRPQGRAPCHLHGQGRIVEDATKKISSPSRGPNAPNNFAKILHH